MYSGFWGLLHESGLESTSRGFDSYYEYFLCLEYDNTQDKEKHEMPRVQVQTSRVSTSSDCSILLSLSQFKLNESQFKSCDDVRELDWESWCRSLPGLQLLFVTEIVTVLSLLKCLKPEHQRFRPHSHSRSCSLSEEFWSLNMITNIISFNAVKTE